MSHLKTLRVLSLATLLASLAVSCTTPEPKATPSIETKAEQPAVAPKPVAETSAPKNGFMPDCLNLVENDRRIEFHKSELLVTETGKPKALDLDSGEIVKCEKLKVIENAREPSVMIVYLTRPKGTSTLVWDRKLGVATLKDAKWTVEPLVLDRMFRSEEGGDETETLTLVKWSEDQGRPVLTLMDLETKTTDVVKP